MSQADILSPGARQRAVRVKFTAKDVVEHPDAPAWYGREWKVGRRLGNGTYGTVWLQQCKDNGHHRAVKQMDQANVQSIVRELETVVKFSQPPYVGCFVQMSCWYEDHHSVYLAMEYLKHGDLQDYAGKNQMSEAQVRGVMLQLFQAVGHLHANGIAHRDLKPQNVLIAETQPGLVVKLADFGLSKSTEASRLRTANVGTERYMAPELRKQDLDFGAHGDMYYPGQEYSVAVDLWSLGIIMFALLTRELPFSNGEWLKRYVQGKILIPKHAWANGRLSERSYDLIATLLSPNPASRGTIRDVVAHPWAANYIEMGA